MLGSTSATPVVAIAARRDGRRPWLLLAAGAVSAAASVLGAVSPAAASAAAPAAPPVAHPDSDQMGSTVALHEQPLATRPATPVTGGDRPAALGAVDAAAAVTGVRGIDVSRYQAGVDWPAVRAGGARFAYVKATEGTGYLNPVFGQQYRGSYAAGLVRGAYHFALPNRSSGTAQADWFVGHGGGWSPDGRTLPPLLDIEYNPYGASCYGLGRAAMVGWLHAFSSRVHARTGRWPAVYTTADWWSTCTGDDGSFAATSPLFVARYAGSVGRLPAGWGFHTFWQYADHGRLPGDQDVFNGSLAQLTALARG